MFLSSNSRGREWQVLPSLEAVMGTPGEELGPDFFLLESGDTGTATSLTAEEARGRAHTGNAGFGIRTLNYHFRSQELFLQGDQP